MTQQRMWGADADALDALARDMQNASNRLDSISRQLSARLMSSAWDGSDADRFRAEWNRKYRAQLRASVEFLREAQGYLGQAGAQQRGASAEDGVAANAALTAIATIGSAMGAQTAGWEGPPRWADRVPGTDEIWDFFSEVFPNAADLADLMGVFPGALGTALSGATSAFGFFSGWMDLVYEQKYDGNFGFVEIGADSLTMLGGGLGVLGLMPTPAAPVLGVAALAATGLGMAINTALDGWDGGGRHAVGALHGWAAPKVDAAIHEIDQSWDRVYEHGRDTAEAIVDGVGEGIDLAMDEMQDNAGAVWEKATGWLPL